MKKSIILILSMVLLSIVMACNPEDEMNGDVTTMPSCDSPIFSPSPGTFTNPIAVTLTSGTTGCQIRYSTNDITPDTNTGILYDSPIYISNSVTIQAMAYQEGYIPSSLTEAEYIITNIVPETDVWISNVYPPMDSGNMPCDIILRVSFSGEISTNNLNSNIIIFSYTNSMTNNESGTYAYSNRTVYFTPDDGLEPLANYGIRVAGVTDTNGIEINPDSTTFQTGRVVKAFARRNGHYYLNPITLKDGYLYAGTCGYPFLTVAEYDSAVYKLDTNLNLIWEYTLGAQGENVLSAVTVDSSGGSYFISASNDTDIAGFLNKLDSSGNPVWRTNYAKAPIGWTPYSPTIGRDDTIYVSGTISNYQESMWFHIFSAVYAFNPDGTIKWKAVTNSYTNGGFELLNYPIIIDQSENLYLSAKQTVEDKAMLVSYTSNGDFRWATTNMPSQEGGKELSSALAFNNNQSQVYIFNRDTLYCVNTSDGSVAWNFGIDMSPSDSYYIRSGVAVDENGVIYFGTKTGSNTNSRFYALNSDGTLKWENTEIDYDFYNVPIFGNDGNIYVFTENSGLNIINKSTGVLVNPEPQYPPYGADITHSSAVMDDNGYIYVGNILNRDSSMDSNSGYILKWKSDATAPLTGAAWPGFQGGNQNLGWKD